MTGVLQERCADCGHSFSFHGKRIDRPCRAVGCSGGPNGWTCTGFVPREDASEELRETLSALSPSP